MAKIKTFFTNFYQTALGEEEMINCAEIVDLLSVFSNDEIKNGLQQYQIAGPRSKNGYLRKPAAGDLYQFLMNERGKSKRLMQSREERANPHVEQQYPIINKPTQSEAQAILDKAGFTAKRTNLLNARPMATTVEELETTPPKKLHWTQTVDPDGPEMAALRKERESYKVKAKG